MPGIKRDKQCEVCGADDWRYRPKKGYDCNPCRYAHLSALQKTPEQAMVARARARARRKGIPCTITAEDIEIPRRCPVLGLELRVSEKHARSASPTLDRIDPRLGYTPENTIVISHRANSIKRDASPPELRAVADWLEARKLEAYERS